MTKFENSWGIHTGRFGLKMAHPDTSRPRPPCGSLPFHYLLCKRTHPYPVTLLPTIGLSYFQAKPSPVRIPQLFSNLVIIYLLAYEDGTECSETSAYKIQTPGNYPEENIQQTILLFIRGFLGGDTSYRDLLGSVTV
jgi:hypothetical protein